MESQTFERKEYATRDFWNSRFSEYKSPFDWYLGWQELKNLLSSNFDPSETGQVLMVGCGNSRLSDAMSKNGYFLINIDISDVVVHQMLEKSRLDYLLMDATRMNFKSQSFDLVIDKGTFDALACQEDSDLPRKIVSEMGRVSCRGVLIVTHGKPSNRSVIFREELKKWGDWNESYFEVELSFQSQFINVLRSSFPGESIASVMKDPEKLVFCFQEVKRFKKNQEAVEKANRQTHCWVYIYKKVI